MFIYVQSSCGTLFQILYHSLEYRKKQLKYMYIVHTWISVPPKKTVIFEIQLKKSVKNMCLSEALETELSKHVRVYLGFRENHA